MLSVSDIVKNLIIITATCLLAACKTEVNSDLFTSDLIAATEGETVTAPIVLGLEVTSEKECKKNAPTILEAITTSFPDAAFVGCERIDFDTFARFRFQVEILNVTDLDTTPENAIAIAVQKRDDRYSVHYLSNTDAAKAIWDQLPKELIQYRDFEINPILHAVLNNDLRTPVDVTTDDVFADGKPVQGTATRSLPRRDQIQISTSNVTNAAFGNVDTAAGIVSFRVAE